VPEEEVDPISEKWWVFFYNTEDANSESQKGVYNTSSKPYGTELI
jgi:hypothetical protein